MFVTNWISPTKIQKISEITNFFRHYFLSRTEVNIEARNSELLKQHGLNQRERRAILHQIAKEQLAVLNTNNVEQKFRKLLGNDPKKLE